MAKMLTSGPAISCVQDLNDKWSRRWITTGNIRQKKEDDLIELIKEVSTKEVVISDILSGHTFKHFLGILDMLLKLKYCYFKRLKWNFQPPEL